ncbi:MAG: alpha/beta fold hydrolase [Fimbriiglobus sp.]
MLETFRASDGYTFTLERRTHPTPRGRVVLLHGIRSHAGWYAASCEKLTNAGYETCFLERRGSGRNLVARGDTPGYRRLVADVVEYIQTQSPLPLHLVGISWGGKLAALVAQQVRAQSLVLIAPGFVPKVRPSFTLRFRIAIARVLKPTRLFSIPLNAPELFTRNSTRQAFLRANPHDLHEATARFFVSSVAMDLKLRPQEPFPCPTLTLLAGDDEVIDNSKTRAFLGHRSEFKEYPGLAHTLEFEDPDLRFVNDILDWLAVSASA